METRNVKEKEVAALRPAIGFIKTRKLDSIAMDMANKMYEEGMKLGFLIQDIFVDRDGDRDIDRTQLDDLYEMMENENVHDLFIRR